MIPWELDKDRLRSVIEQELDQFKRDWYVEPIPEVQFMRPLCVSWVCTFLPEIVSEHLVRKLEHAVRDFQSRETFSTFGWTRTPALSAALFALTGEMKWLSYEIANIDHHNSRSRQAILEALPLIANKISFFAEDYRERVHNNLLSGNMYADWSLTLLAVGVAPVEAKREVFMEWADESAMPGGHRERLVALARNEFVVNPMAGILLEIQQYVSLRLANAGDSIPTPLVLPEIEQQRQELEREGRDPQLVLLESRKPPLADVVWGRLRSHPLSESYLRLSKEHV
jgi:hypothetical protein